MSFAHPIFTAAVAGGRRLATQAGAIIFRELGESAVRMAADAVVGLAVETAEAAVDLTLEQISQLSTSAIAALIGPHCPGQNEDRFVRNDQVVTRLLNEVATRDNGAVELAEAFESRASDFQFQQELSQQVATISTPAGCALGLLRSENDIVARRKFPDGSNAPARIRQCTRQSTDGFRVSREVHEWEYCRQNQFGDVLAEARQWAIRVNNANEGSGDLPNGFAYDNLLNQVTVEAIAVGTSDLSFATRDYTFGNFVDGVQIRKGIEHLRRVRRSVTGARFTELFRLLNMDADAVVSQVNNNTDWSPQLREIVLLDVTIGSGQSGSEGTDGAGPIE